jgi:hypothetical protein
MSAHIPGRTFVLLVSAITFSAGAASKHEQAERLEIRHVSPSASSVPRFKLLSFDIDLRAAYLNPFDSSEIAIDAEFTPPSGQKLMVPGFFDQRFTRMLTNRSERLAPELQDAFL